MATVVSTKSQKDKGWRRLVYTALLTAILVPVQTSVAKEQSINHQEIFADFDSRVHECNAGQPDKILEVISKFHFLSAVLYNINRTCAKRLEERQPRVLAPYVGQLGFSGIYLDKISSQEALAYIDVLFSGGDRLSFSKTTNELKKFLNEELVARHISEQTYNQYLYLFDPTLKPPVFKGSTNSSEIEAYFTHVSVVTQKEKQAFVVACSKVEFCSEAGGNACIFDNDLQLKLAHSTGIEVLSPVSTDECWENLDVIKSARITEQLRKLGIVKANCALPLQEIAIRSGKDTSRVGCEEVLSYIYKNKLMSSTSHLTIRQLLEIDAANTAKYAESLSFILFDAGIHSNKDLIGH